MAEKIQVVVDVNTDSVTIATDRTLTLQQQLKVLKRELQTVPEGTQEWNLINAKFNDTKDALDRVNVKSRELFGTLNLIPGPIGAIAGKVNGAIDAFKVFSSFKLTDIQAQFKAFGDDLKGVISVIGNATGITKVFEGTAGLLEKGFLKLGIGADKAATAARGFAGTLTAAGIGAIIYAIYSLVDAYNSLSKEQELTNELAAESAKIAGKQISLLDELDALVKNSATTDRQKDEAVKEYNSTLGDTLGKVNNWIELENKLIGKLPEYKAYLLKRAEAEATSMLITKAITDKIQTEMTDPASMAGFYDVWSEGGILGFFIEGKKGIGENIRKRALTNADKTIAALTDRLTKTNQEITAQQKSLGLDAAPTETKKTTQKAEKTPEQIARETIAANLQVVLSQKQLQEQVGLALTKGEKDRLSVRENYAKINYNIRLKAADDELMLAKKYHGEDSTEYKNALASRNSLTADYLKQVAGFAEVRENMRQKELDNERKETEKKAAENKERLKNEREADLVALNTKYQSIQAAKDQNDIDFQDDLERIQEQRTILDEQERIELANLELTEAERTRIIAEYSKRRQELDKEETQTLQAQTNYRRQILNEYLDAAAQFGQFLQQIAGKSKGVAIAGVIIDKAAAIAKITAQMLSVPPVLPPGVPNPAFIPSRISGALSIASMGVAAYKAIQQIRNPESDQQTAVNLKMNAEAGARGSVGGGGGTTPAFSIPSITAPQVGTGLSQSGTIAGIVAGTMNANQSQMQPLRAYVVQNDIRTESQLDRRIRTAARLGG